jgi:hypothetical protein
VRPPAPIARKLFDAYLLGKMPEADAPEGNAIPVGATQHAAPKPDFGNVVAAQPPAVVAP